MFHYLMFFWIIRNNFNLFWFYNFFYVFNLVISVNMNMSNSENLLRLHYYLFKFFHIIFNLNRPWTWEKDMYFFYNFFIKNLMADKIFWPNFLKYLGSKSNKVNIWSYSSEKILALWFPCPNGGCNVMNKFGLFLKFEVLNNPITETGINCN